MATIVETGVVASVQLSRDPDGTNHAWASASSTDSNGNIVRSITNVDIYNSLDAAGKQTVINALNYVNGLAKNYFEIP